MKYFSKYQYPQRLFAKEIFSKIRKKKLGDCVLVDVPCGNGETTYYFSQKLACKEILGYDISPNAIKTAKNNFDNSAIHWEVKNIFDVFDGARKYDIICIINSLFLLPDPERVLAGVQMSLAENGVFFVIVPNINSENYCFLPDVYKELNKLVLNFDDMSSFFIKHHFTIVSFKGIAHANLYGRKELKYLSVLAPFYLYFLNYFFSLLKMNKPGYFLFELKYGKYVH